MIKLSKWVEGPPPVRDDGSLAIIILLQGVFIDDQPVYGKPVIVSRWCAKLKTTAGAFRLDYDDVLRHIELEL